MDMGANCPHVFCPRVTSCPILGNWISVHKVSICHQSAVFLNRHVFLLKVSPFFMYNFGAGPSQIIDGANSRSRSVILREQLT